MAMRSAMTRLEGSTRRDGDGELNAKANAKAKALRTVKVKRRSDGDGDAGKALRRSENEGKTLSETLRRR